MKLKGHQSGGSVLDFGTEVNKSISNWIQIDNMVGDRASAIDTLRSTLFKHYKAIEKLKQYHETVKYDGINSIICIFIVD